MSSRTTEPHGGEVDPGSRAAHSFVICGLDPRVHLSWYHATHALADDKDKIVGTWKLVSVVYEDQASKERTPVLGEHPRGRQIATADGRWRALVTAEGRPVPKTDAERARCRP